MLKLNKELLKDMRAASSLVVRRDTKKRGVMELIIDGKLAGKSVQTRKSWLCEVRLRSYKAYDYDTKEAFFEPDPQDSVCCAVLSVYSGDHVSYILSTLKADDEIAFEFLGNSGNTHGARHGLHHDSIKLLINRGNHRINVDLDNWVCPGNSARAINRGSSFSRDDINPASYEYENREPEEEAKEEAVSY